MSGNNKSIPTSIPASTSESVLPQQVHDESLDLSDNTDIMDTDTQSMAPSEPVYGESTDAIENLRLTLKNLTQRLARGVATHYGARAP